jgi:hypothetical protein
VWSAKSVGRPEPTSVINERPFFNAPTLEIVSVIPSMRLGVLFRVMAV